jgi:hypothetical protein
MLPKTLAKKDLRKKLESQYTEEKQLIRDSVDLSIGLNNLKTICDDLEKIKAAIQAGASPESYSQQMEQI